MADFPGGSPDEAEACAALRKLYRMKGLEAPTVLVADNHSDYMIAMDRLHSLNRLSVPEAPSMWRAPGFRFREVDDRGKAACLCAIALGLGLALPNLGFLPCLAILVGLAVAAWVVFPCDGREPEVLCGVVAMVMVGLGAAATCAEIAARFPRHPDILPLAALIPFLLGGVGISFHVREWLNFRSAAVVKRKRRVYLRESLGLHGEAAIDADIGFRPEWRPEHVLGGAAYDSSRLWTTGTEPLWQAGGSDVEALMEPVTREFQRAALRRGIAVLLRRLPSGEAVSYDTAGVARPLPTLTKPGVSRPASASAPGVEPIPEGDRVVAEVLGPKVHAETMRLDATGNLAVERAVSQLGLRPFHSDGSGDLFRIPGLEEDTQFVRVIDPAVLHGHDAVRWLAVPPHVLEAQEGVAWSYGLKPRAYAPTLEG